MNNINGGSNKYEIYDYITYKSDGIYQIIDIRNIKFNDDDKKMYYIIKSKYENNSVVYVPVDSKDLVEQMQPVLTPDEINEIIENTETIKEQWISDIKLRSKRFDQIISAGDRTQILYLIKTISAQKINLKEQKKRMSELDAQILARAEKMIKEEFAFSLNIDIDDVTSYILEHKK